jgi:hypothetical protein
MTVSATEKLKGTWEELSWYRERYRTLRVWNKEALDFMRKLVEDDPNHWLADEANDLLKKWWDV